MVVCSQLRSEFHFIKTGFEPGRSENDDDHKAYIKYVQFCMYSMSDCYKKYVFLFLYKNMCTLCEVFLGC